MGGRRLPLDAASPRVRLRILHLAFDDPRRPGSGGGAIRNHEINRRLARRHDVTAVTVTYPDARERIEDGVHYLPVGLPIGYYGAILTYFMALPVVVWTRRFDLLVEDFAAPFGSVLVPLWTRSAVIAHVQWLSAGEKSRQYHLPFFLTERWGARAHRRMIAVSESVAHRLRELNPGAEVIVLPNGLPPEARRTAWLQARPRRDALFLGRLEIAGKGLDLLLAAFARIAERTAADLVIAGDGPDSRALAALVGRQGLAGRVRMIGRVDGPARFDLLAGAQVVCMPTRYESFGLVALEALACATPVLAFDIPALSELLTPQTSVMVPAFDADAYAEALLGLLADPERCRQMGDQGRRWTRRLDWSRIARCQEDVYLRAVGRQRLLGSGAGPGGARARSGGPRVPELRQTPEHARRRAFHRSAGAHVRATLAWSGELLLRSDALVAPVVAGVAAFLVRAAMVPHAFEIHVDEATYLRIAQDLGGSLHLVYDLAGSHPFFLHPPLFLVIEAAYLRLIAPAGDPAQQVIAVRTVDALLGGASAAVLFVLCRRLAGPLAAAVAAAMFALDPFIVRMDSRNFLDPSALFWILLGLCALVGLCDRWRPGPRWLGAPAGFAFGAALLTNEPSAFVTLLPLGLCGLMGVLRPRRAAVIAAIALATYSVYPLLAILTGNWDQFREQKLTGLRRFSGLEVTTGFNGTAGPSFLHTLSSSWQAFAPTYGLLAVGLLASLWLVSRRDRRSRLIGCWAGSAYGLQAYMTLFGTSEEQYFIYVTVMAVLAVVIAARGLLGRAPPRSGVRAAAALLAAYLGLSGYVAVTRLTTPDDGYLRLAAYLEVSAPPGTAIAATSPADAVLLREQGYAVTNMARVTDERRNRPRIQSPQALLAGHPRYVVVETALVDEGYGVGTPELERWLRRNTRLVFSFDGPSDGRLEAFRVPDEMP